MNPYLEQPSAWHDFHESFCYECRRLLSSQLGPRYVAKLDEHVYLHEFSSHESSAEERRLLGLGDVTVADAGAGASVVTGGTAIAAPVEVELPTTLDLERENYIEIRDREGFRLITVVELLGPANKQHGPDRRQFLAKRQEFLSSGVNYVEIDLLRGGPRMPVKARPDCDYYAVVSRAGRRPKADLWPIRLRDRLPPIPVPLDAPDPDVTLDLQEAFHRAYDAGGYEKYIYSGSPVPPLSPEDQRWAGELLASAARRA
jgi:hypothetical protein